MNHILIAKAIVKSLHRSSVPYLLATLIFMGSFAFGAFATMDATGSTSPAPALPPMTFGHIFANNMQNVAMLSLGVVLLGAPTLLNLFVNGFTLGAQLTSFLAYAPGDVAVVALLPHAVLELPGLFVAGAAGLKVPYEGVRYLRGKRGGVTEEDIYDIILLVLLASLLIFAAAIIESQITIPLVRWYIR